MRATPKSLRFLQLAATIKSDSLQTPEQLWRNLGIKKAQFNYDKKELEKIGFVFRYDRTQRRFVILKDAFLPVHDLTLTGTFALTMNDPREVGWWVFQWGADAEVLEPESLRQELRETAERLVEVYGEKPSVKKPGADDAIE